MERGDLGEEAYEVMTALNSSATVRTFMIANTGPNANRWDVAFPDKWTGKLHDVATGKTIRVHRGQCVIELPAYGYAVNTIRTTSYKSKQSH